MSSCLVSSFEGLSLLSPRSHGLLDVHPLVSPHPTTAVYRTLDDALESGGFRVEECEQATVPTLTVVNELDEPVLILDGEILVGGQQDRAVNTTVLVAARSRLEVPVSCVEARRWGGGRRFRRSDGVLFTRSRSSRSRAVSESLRRGHGYASDQQRLWSDVRARIDEVGCEAPTDSVTRAAAARAEELDEYVSALGTADGQVGAVFAVAGKVVGVEVASSPAAYARVHAKLLKSVAMDALAAATRGESAPAAPESVEEFLSEVSRARREEHPAVGLGHASRIEGERLTGARLEHDGALVHCVAFRLDEEPGPNDEFDSTCPPWHPDRRWDRRQERVRRATGAPQTATPPPNALQHWLLENQERLEWYAGQACNAVGLGRTESDDVADEVFVRLWHEFRHEAAIDGTPRRRVAACCREVAQSRADHLYADLLAAPAPAGLPLPAPRTSVSRGRTVFVHVVTVAALARALDALRAGQPVALASREDRGAWECLWPTDTVLLACPTANGVVAHVVANVSGYEGGDPRVSAGNLHRTSVVESAREVHIALQGRYAIGSLHRITRRDLDRVRTALA